MFAPGTVLAGKYRVERMLGSGGMAWVVLCHHVQLDQPVAIKFLMPEMLSNPETVQRFQREARASVKLESEHSCHIHDVGALDDGTPYIVMEYLDGTDLAEFVAEQGALAPGLAVDLALQVCEVLAEAHSLGIIHRDIKSSNIFLTCRADGSVQAKVLDFGISKTPVDSNGEFTRTHAVLGTPTYMSPEQMRSSKDADARSDIWGLGVVLYELLCGRLPFRAETYSQLCFSIVTSAPRPLNSTVPPGLAQVVMRCLEKDPAARFRNVAGLAVALAPFAGSRSQAEGSIRRTGRILGMAEAVTNAFLRRGPQREMQPGAPTLLSPPETLASFREKERCPGKRNAQVDWSLGPGGRRHSRKPEVRVRSSGMPRESGTPWRCR